MYHLCQTSVLLAGPALCNVTSVRHDGQSQVGKSRRHTCSSRGVHGHVVQLLQRPQSALAAFVLADIHHTASICRIAIPNRAIAIATVCKDTQIRR